MGAWELRLSGSNPINLGFHLERFAACCCRQCCPAHGVTEGALAQLTEVDCEGMCVCRNISVVYWVATAIMYLSDCRILLGIQMLRKEARESRWSNTCLKKPAPKEKELDGFVFVCSEVMATENSFSKINCFSILQRKSNENDAREHPFI